MEHEGFDRLVRSMANGLTRRGMLKRFAASSFAGPGALLVGGSAATQRNNDKDRDQGRGRCRANGESCDGGQTCCPGLACAPAEVGGSLRCQPLAAVIAGNNPAASNASAANQTVTNSSVCAGDCDVNQNAQAAIQVDQEATVQQGSAGTVGQVGTPVGGGFVRLPSYRVDVDCRYEASVYHTVCVGVAVSPEGAPAVRGIVLPEREICPVIIEQESTPAEFEEVVIRRPIDDGGGGGGQASAGTGGTASADASGGTVSIGNVDGGSTNISIDASGGNASADASGGDNNIAIVGGGGAPREDVIRQLRQVEPSSIMLVLEGNVVPARQATYWLDTEAGRLPASGPGFTLADETTQGAGAIVIDTYGCAVPGPQEGFDWFAECTEPADPIEFALFPAEGGSSEPIAVRRTGESGRVRFPDLQPGRYRLEPRQGTWCHAESDAVDEAGNVVVEAGRESGVWIFTCQNK